MNGTLVPTLKNLLWKAIDSNFIFGFELVVHGGDELLIDFEEVRVREFAFEESCVHGLKGNQVSNLSSMYLSWKCSSLNASTLFSNFAWSFKKWYTLLKMYFIISSFVFLNTFIRLASVFNTSQNIFILAFFFKSKKLEN